MSAVKKAHIHVLYEYGAGLRPYGSAFLRLIRPFTHPLVSTHIDTTFSRDYNQEAVDAVVIDRLWRRDVSFQLIEGLLDKIHLAKAKLIYSLDDNYFDLPFEEGQWPTRDYLPIVSLLLRQADAVLVTTPALRQRLLEFNKNIYVLPNQLDERLLVRRLPPDGPRLFNTNRLVIGYMGTFTHDEDIKMVLPAFKSLQRRHPGLFELQLIGVVNREETKKELNELPVRYVYPLPAEHEYPLFMLWFTGHVRWDIAISPLQNTIFNQCKSDIKFLDYASIGAAGVYSKCAAYSSTVHHTQDGWIVENTPTAWEEALEILLQDTNSRLLLAKNSINRLYQERILAKRAGDWVEAIQSIC